MRTPAFLALTVLLLVLNQQLPGGGAPLAVTSPASVGCPSSGSGQMRTTIYFGLSHRAGTVSESEWQAFLRKEVTGRFPEGLTVWGADGQWRRNDGSIGRERTKVLLLVHQETPAARANIATIVDNYRKSFHQESVLWETAPVCAAF
jgi:hypothetical protein